MAKRGKQKQKQKGKPDPRSAAGKAAATAVAATADSEGAGQPDVGDEPTEDGLVGDAGVPAGEVAQEAAAEDGQDESRSGEASAETPDAATDESGLDESGELDAAEVSTAADEAETVTEAAAEPGLQEDVAAEVAPVAPKRPRRARPRDNRSPFLVLADFEQRSLAHVAGLPEQLDAPGLWRGVAFRIGTRRLASGFDEVLEILPMPPVTHIPGSLPWMLGVANIRGTLLPVVDLKQFLEGERTVLQEKQRVLVVHQPGGDVAVTIDELFGQRSFNDSQSVDPTVIADGRYAHFVERAYRFDGHDWGVFSLNLLARTPEFRQAAA